MVCLDKQTLRGLTEGPFPLRADCIGQAMRQVCAGTVCFDKASFTAWWRANKLAQDRLGLILPRPQGKDRKNVPFIHKSNIQTTSQFELKLVLQVQHAVTAHEPIIVAWLSQPPLPAGDTGELLAVLQDPAKLALLASAQGEEMDDDDDSDSCSDSDSSASDTVRPPEWFAGGIRALLRLGVLHLDGVQTFEAFTPLDGADPQPSPKVRPTNKRKRAAEQLPATVLREKTEAASFGDPELKAQLLGYFDAEPKRYKTAYHAGIHALQKALHDSRDSPAERKKRFVLNKGGGASYNAVTLMSAVKTHQSAPEMHAREKASSKKIRNIVGPSAISDAERERRRWAKALDRLAPFADAIRAALTLLYPVVTGAAEMANSHIRVRERPGEAPWPETWQLLAGEKECGVPPPMGLFLEVFRMVRAAVKESSPNLEGFSSTSETNVTTFMRLFVNSLIPTGAGLFTPQPSVHQKAKMAVATVPGGGDGEWPAFEIKAVSDRTFTTEDATGVNGDKLVGNYHQDPDDPVMNPSDLTYRGIYKDAGSAAFGLLGNETVEELAALAIGNTDPASANFDPLPDPVFGLGRHIELGAASEAGAVTAHAARAKGVVQEVVTRLVAMGQSGERMGGLRSKVGTITIEFGNPADSSQVLNDCHILFQKIHVPHTPGNEAVLGFCQMGGWMTALGPTWRLLSARSP